MSKVVDARGLTCPQPVILTKRAMAEAGVITTIVDNETSRDNVSRMAGKRGRPVTIEEQEDGFYVHIGAAQSEPEPRKAIASVGVAGPSVLVVSADVMGKGPEELGQILIRGFFHTLGEVEPLPEAIIFFNTGVRLVAENSPVMEDLQALQDAGIEILACGTCLDYLSLKERVAVGRVSNMYTIAETLLGAGKVISL